MTHDTTADAVERVADAIMQALDRGRLEDLPPEDTMYMGHERRREWRRVAEKAIAAMTPPVAVTEAMVEAGAKALVGLKYRTSQDIARACLTAALEARHD